MRRYHQGYTKDTHHSCRPCLSLPPAQRLDWPVDASRNPRHCSYSHWIPDIQRRGVRETQGTQTTPESKSRAYALLRNRPLALETTEYHVLPNIIGQCTAERTSGIRNGTAQGPRHRPIPRVARGTCNTQSTSIHESATNMYTILKPVLFLWS